MPLPMQVPPGPVPPQQGIDQAAIVAQFLQAMQQKKQGPKLYSRPPLSGNIAGNVTGNMGPSPSIGVGAGYNPPRRSVPPTDPRKFQMSDIPGIGQGRLDMSDPYHWKEIAALLQRVKKNTSDSMYNAAGINPEDPYNWQGIARMKMATRRGAPQ